MRYRKIHIYDLDGVLVDSSHRYKTLADGSIDLNYWIKHHTPQNVHKDTLLPLAKKYTSDVINPRIYTILCTARMITTFDLAFIIGFLGMPEKLIMRPEGDYTPDPQYKRRELVRLLNLKQFRHLPVFAWDDNVRNLTAIVEFCTRVFWVKSETYKHEHK